MKDTKSPGVTTLLSFHHLLCTKVTVLALQESTFPFLQEKEYDFKAQQTSETVKYMHHVRGNTSSCHLLVLMLDTENLLYLPL